MERNSLEVINRDFYDFKAVLKKHDLNPFPHFHRHTLGQCYPQV